MSQSRKLRVIDADPGAYIQGVMVTPAKVAVAEGDDECSVAELQSFAARMDPARYAVTDAKRERVKAKRRNKPNCRTLTVGHWHDIDGHCKVRISLTGDAGKIRYEFLRRD